MGDRKVKRGNALEMAVAMRDRNVLQMVDEAIRGKNVMLAFQPVVQGRDPSRIAFFEGLIRVMDETRRIIPAREFITQIEDSDLGREIDVLALQFGLQALAQVPTLRLSINMSALSIDHPKWMRTMDSYLAQIPAAAERLIIEITESSVILHPDRVKSFMDRLQSRGVSFALDDFGAGYTAFRYFKQFHFDILKIDGDFIRGVARDADNQVLTQALLSIGQQFDMFTVAESVETAEDAAWLQAIGMDCLQGYYFGAPSVTPPWKMEYDQGVRRA